MHPFKGGIAVLDIFARLNIIKLDNQIKKDSFERIKALLEDSR